MWQGIREHKGWIWVAAGVIALGPGVVATWQSDDNFGRIPAAYGGIFVAGGPRRSGARRMAYGALTLYGRASAQPGRSGPKAGAAPRAETGAPPGGAERSRGLNQ